LNSLNLTKSERDNGRKTTDLSGGAQRNGGQLAVDHLEYQVAETRTDALDQRSAGAAYIESNRGPLQLHSTLRWSNLYASPATRKTKLKKKSFKKRIEHALDTRNRFEWTLGFTWRHRARNTSEPGYNSELARTHLSATAFPVSVFFSALFTHCFSNFEFWFEYFLSAGSSLLVSGRRFTRVRHPKSSDIGDWLKAPMPKNTVQLL